MRCSQQVFQERLAPETRLPESTISATVQLTAELTKLLESAEQRPKECQQPLWTVDHRPEDFSESVRRRAGHWQLQSDAPLFNHSRHRLSV